MEKQIFHSETSLSDVIEERMIEIEKEIERDGERNKEIERE